MSTDTDASIANAIKRLSAIERAVTEWRNVKPVEGGLTAMRTMDNQVRDVVQLITATEGVRQLDRLVRAAS